MGAAIRKAKEARMCGMIGSGANDENRAEVDYENERCKDRSGIEEETVVTNRTEKGKGLWGVRAPTHRNTMVKSSELDDAVLQP